MKTNSQKLLNSIHVGNHTINRALSSDHEVIQCAYVRGGHFKSNYEDWVQHSKPCVRKLIAETYPEYIPLLPCETDWELDKVKTYLLDYFKPKLNVLEKFLAKVGPVQKYNTEVIALQLKHETLTRDMTDWFLQLGTEGLNVHLSNFNKVQYEAIKLIYQAETTVPTTIEKTMTPSQLYLQGSPLWIKSVDWPFSATIIKSTTSKQETAKMIDIMLGN